MTKGARTLIQDFRRDDPVWVWYGTFIGDNPGNMSGQSRKYIEARIDLADDGTFIFTRRYGALPDTGWGSVTQTPHASLPAAQSTANTWIRSKTRKGYRECDRPLFETIQSPNERERLWWSTTDD